LDTLSLPFLSFSAAEAGQYRVIVSNIAGTVTSSIAIVTVRTPPQLLDFSVSPTLAYGDDVIELSALATGTAPLTFAWLVHARYDSSAYFFILWAFRSAILLPYWMLDVMRGGGGGGG
jgi:hypothetical protein